jgi:rhodanese-related sulfurtransferase
MAQALSPQEGARFLEHTPDALLIDVRSSMEYLFVGHPVGAEHLAWIDEPDWEVDPQFAEHVLRLIRTKRPNAPDPNNVPVVLICRSGNRSHEAGNVLIDYGFRQVFHIDEGFEGELDVHHRRSSVGGWRFHGLAWEQC